MTGGSTRAPRRGEGVRVNSEGLEPERSLPVAGVATWLVAGLSLLCILLTLLPFIGTDEWYIRLWDFPRLQLMVALLVLLIAWLAIRPRTRAYWGLALALAAAALWQSSFALAYLPFGPRQVESVVDCPDGNSISVLNINVFQDNRDFDRTLDLVRRTNADVVLFLETDEAWARALTPLLRQYRHVESVPISNTYGMILMSHWPMSSRVRYRMQPDIPSIDASIIMPSGEQIDLYALHPEPPLPGDDSGERDAELVMAGRDVRNSGRAALVVGDLNDVAWSETSRLFRDVSGTADPRVGRGLYPTFNAKYPLFRWPLDHLFVTPHWRVQTLDRLAKVGSDHFPMLFRMCLVEPADRRLTAVLPAPAVREEAREEAAEGKREDRAEGND